MFCSGVNPEAVLINRIARHLLVTCALALLALPAPAFASADQVVRDCVYDGKLDHHYSNAELRRARDHLPSDADEYSDCRDVIAAAIKGGSDRSGGAPSPGIAATNPAAEAAAQVDRPVRSRGHREQRQGAAARRRRPEPQARQQRLLQPRAGRPTRFRFPC